MLTANYSYFTAEMSSAQRGAFRDYFSLRANYLDGWSKNDDSTTEYDAGQDCADDGAASGA